MFVRIANSEEPYQTASSEADCFFGSSLTWFCAICLGFFGRLLLFEILEHLQYHHITLYDL